MSRAAAQHSANILPQQWQGLNATLHASHPDASYTANQRQFLSQFIKNDGYLKTEARFSLTMLRDEWCMLLQQETVRDLVPFRARSLDEKEAYILDMRKDLARAINRRQDTLPLEGLNKDQELFKFLEIDEDSMALSFLLQVGMWISFRHQPESNSWHIAGKAYLLGQLCKIIFLARHPDAENELPDHLNDGSHDDADDNENSGEGDQSDDGASNDSESERDEEVKDDEGDRVEELDRFIPNNSFASKLKSCVFATWHKHYQDGASWNEKYMLDTWLHEGLGEFKRHVRLAFSANCFPAIANTANNWISTLPSLAKMASRTAPEGTWIDTIAGSTAQRKMWLDYHSILLAQKKMSAPPTAKRLSEAAGVSAAAVSRKKLRDSILNAPVTAPTPAPTTASSASSTANTGGDLMSLLDRAQKADREWVAQLQSEARDLQQQRHNEVMSALAQNAQHHQELMQGLREMFGAFVSQSHQRNSFSFASPPPPQQKSAYNYSGNSYSMVTNSGSSRGTTGWSTN